MNKTSLEDDLKVRQEEGFMSRRHTRNLTLQEDDITKKTTLENDRKKALQRHHKKTLLKFGHCSNLRCVSR